ncbi:MAG: hypothetical protein U9P61_02475 [Patescibacteria group bacterium]|nr:hypothetical protein [Patescibacteria group bacterium]
MNKHLSLILRKTIGVILIILGLIGGLIPIPLVPFFLLIFVGLSLFGVKKETVEKVKLKKEEFIKKIFK